MYRAKMVEDVPTTEEFKPLTTRVNKTKDNHQVTLLSSEEDNDIKLFDDPTKDEVNKCYREALKRPGFRKLLDRTFLDSLYKDKKMRNGIKTFTEAVVDKIISGFQVKVKSKP